MMYKLFCFEFEYEENPKLILIDSNGELIDMDIYLCINFKEFISLIFHTKEARDYYNNILSNSDIKHRLMGHTETNLPPNYRRIIIKI